VDFVEICNICARKAIIKAAKRIINSDEMCRSYSDLNFGVTFLEHSVCLLLCLVLCIFCVCIQILAKFLLHISTSFCQFR